MNELSKGLFKVFLVSLALFMLALFSVGTENHGYVAVVGIPFFIGLISSRWLRLRYLVYLPLSVSILIGLFFAVSVLNIGGFLCSAMFFIICGIPYIIGGVVGRSYLEQASDGKISLSVAPLFLLAMLEKEYITEWPEEEVVTQIEVPGKSQDVFEKLHFYEGSELTPPRILKIALPNPLRVEGNMFEEGAIVKCLYEEGHLVKKMTSVEENKLVAFDVIKQVNIEDRSVRLISGKISLEESGDKVIVTMTTRYVPKLGARLLWRQSERLIVKALHEHIGKEL